MMRMMVVAQMVARYEQAAAIEDRAGQLRDDGLLLGEHATDVAGEERDAQKERAQDQRHPNQG